ncbi:unnamed protein product [Moneuplotes crassus]|uniref:Uncharacterized protein n=1 Tax=Euplotes crassus TaxID=5936 RepID=A0AAD1XQV5_EUPCR|nr:unnamed protein product [Moneuplotes crassus]
MLSTNKDCKYHDAMSETKDDSGTPFSKHFTDIFIGKTRFCKHEGSCMENSAKTLIKASIAGLAVKGCLSVLFGAVKTKSFFKAFRNIVSWDTARFAGFIGLLPTLFKVTLCTLRKIRKKDDKLNSIIASFVCSLSAILDSSDDRRKLLIYYVFARAFESSLKIIDDHQIASVPKNWGLIIYILMTNMLSYWIYFEWKVVPKTLFNIVSKRTGIKPNDRVLLEVIYREIGK